MVTHMTLEEAIRHCEEVAELNEHIATTFPEDGPADIEKCAACADEHRQLAEWLKELKEFRAHGYRYQEVIVTHEKTGRKEEMILDRKQMKLLAFWMTCELAQALGHPWEVDDGT